MDQNRYRYKKDRKGSTWDPLILEGQGTIHTWEIALRPRRPKRGRQTPRHKKGPFNKSVKAYETEPRQLILPFLDHFLRLRGGNPLLLRGGDPLLLLEGAPQKLAH